MQHAFGNYETAVINRTLTLIKKAHDGQMYGDEPYWTHPVAVAETLENPTYIEYVAALLHDVVEDTACGLDILSEIYCEEIVSIVDDCTKRSGTYEQNIQRIIDSKNKSSMKVKLADNKVNSSGDKSKMSAERRDRLNAKYTMSMKMLEEAINEV